MADTGINLAELVTSGRHVVVQCGACPHRAVVKPAALGVPLATAVTLAGANLICSASRSKRFLTTRRATATRARGASGERPEPTVHLVISSPGGTRYG